MNVNTFSFSLVIWTSSFMRALSNTPPHFSDFYKFLIDSEHKPFVPFTLSFFSPYTHVLCFHPQNFRAEEIVTHNFHLHASLKNRMISVIWDKIQWNKTQRHPKWCYSVSVLGGPQSETDTVGGQSPWIHEVCLEQIWTPDRLRNKASLWEGEMGVGVPWESAFPQVHTQQAGEGSPLRLKPNESFVRHSSGG